MSPSDLLDLRRRVAPLLRPPSGAQTMSCALECRSVARWTRTTHMGDAMRDWRPVLDDDGTIGAMLGELVRRAAGRGWRVTVTPAAMGYPAEVALCRPDGTWEDLGACHVHAELGIALALALVEVAS